MVGGENTNGYLPTLGLSMTLIQAPIDHNLTITTCSLTQTAKSSHARTTNSLLLVFDTLVLPNVSYIYI